MADGASNNGAPQTGSAQLTGAVGAAFSNILSNPLSTAGLGAVYFGKNKFLQQFLSENYSEMWNTVLLSIADGTILQFANSMDDMNRAAGSNTSVMGSLSSISDTFNEILNAPTASFIISFIQYLKNTLISQSLSGREQEMVRLGLVSLAEAVGFQLCNSIDDSSRSGSPEFSAAIGKTSLEIMQYPAVSALITLIMMLQNYATRWSLESVEGTNMRIAVLSLLQAVGFQISNAVDDVARQRVSVPRIGAV